MGGEILIDGKSIEEYNLLELRRQIGFVMQEPLLFRDTIKENILFGKPEASDEEVYLAARKANALTFIEAQDIEDEDQIRERQEQET